MLKEIDHKDGDKNLMKLTLGQMADILDAAFIDVSRDLGHAVVHIGRFSDSPQAVPFILVNDVFGNVSLWPM